MADYVVRMTGQDNLSGTIKQVKSELNDLGKTTSKLDQIDKKFNKITNSAAGVKKEMRDLTALGSQLKFDGDYNAAQLLKIAKAAGEAKDSMDDFNAMRKYFADDNRHLNTAIQGMQGLAAAGSVTAGVLGMVGVEQEKVNQAILWCQSALSVLNGLNTIANVLNKDSYVSIAMKVAGLKAEAAAIDKATEAQTRNNIAVKANPYVMLAMVVAAAAVAVYNFAKSNDEAARAQEDLNAVSENYKKNQESQNQTLAESIVKFKSLQNQWNDLGNDLNAKKKFVDDNKTAFKDLGLKVNDVTGAESVFGKNANAIIAAMKARARATAAYATMVDNLKDQYVKLGEIERKIKNGEQFSQSDLADIGILNPDAMAGLREDFTFSALFGGQKYYTVIGKSAADQIMNAATVTLENRADELNKPFELAAKRAQEEAASVPFYSPGSSSSGSGRSGRGGSGSGSSGSEEIKAEANSLNDLKKQRQELLNIIGNQNLSEADLVTKIQEVANLDLQIKDREKQINDEIARRQKLIQDNIKAQRKGLDIAVNTAPTWKTYLDNVNQAQEAAQKARERLHNLNEMLAEWMQKQEELKENKVKALSDAYAALGESFSSVGSIFSAVGEEAVSAIMSIVGTTLQGVSQVIPQIMALIGAKEGEALASGTASAAAMPFPANIAAIAAVVATILSTFATIASVAGKFAGGGVVGGGSSYGDMVMARVNAGEMILNRRQQANLFRAIESGNIGAGQTVLVPEFKIKGSDLYGTLRNFSKSVGKTGKVTGIR